MNQKIWCLILSGVIISYQNQLPLPRDQLTTVKESGQWVNSPYKYNAFTTFKRDYLYLHVSLVQCSQDLICDFIIGWKINGSTRIFLLAGPTKLEGALIKKGKKIKFRWGHCTLWSPSISVSTDLSARFWLLPWYSIRCCLYYILQKEVHINIHRNHIYKLTGILQDT